MHSEIDDYRNDSDDDNEKDKSPRQRIQICTLPFERIKHDEIGHSDHYGDDDHGSSEESNIHRRSQRINILRKTFCESQIAVGEISDILDAVADCSQSADADAERES